jgi:hypothetical protein
MEDTSGNGREEQGGMTLRMALARAVVNGVGA